MTFEAAGRLSLALADRYRLERAMVYLAEDLKHHRKVAVKALKCQGVRRRTRQSSVHTSGAASSRAGVPGRRDDPRAIATRMAFLALVFLVVIHKGEYFLIAAG